jgi:thioredoxin 1
MDYLPWVIGGLMLAFMIVQLLPLLRARQQQGRPVALAGLVSADQLAQPKLLFYFWSPSCGMCSLMTPTVERLAQLHPQLVSVNVQDRPDVASALGVLATPCLVLVQLGRIETVKLGAKSEAQIRALLDA